MTAEFLVQNSTTLSFLQAVEKLNVSFEVLGLVRAKYFCTKNTFHDVIQYSRYGMPTDRNLP